MKAILFLAILGALAVSAACSSTNQLVNANTNECVNVPYHGYPVEGTPVRIKQCDPWQNQQWAFNDGHITGVGGFCLDVQGSAAVEGAPINYVPCDGRPSQNWTLVNGVIQGIGGKCVDVQGGAPYNQAPLILATCSGSPTQQWVVH